MRVINLTSPLSVAALVLAAGCARSEDRAAASRAEILAPADGDSVTLPFTVRLAAHGIEIVAATGVREEGRGHHHLLVDVDPPAPGAPLPAATGFIHLGTGAVERVLDSLPPGPHRIIAVLAYGDHVPMAAVATDTVRIVVR